MRYFSYFLILVWPVIAYGQSLPVSGTDEPLEITAEGYLEWNRTEQTFTAEKNAAAKQGEVSIQAQTLTAYYREPEGKKMEVWKLDGQSNVHINSRQSTAYGEHVTYDVDSGMAVMMGGNLKLVSDGQILTARDKFEYNVLQGRLTAVGGAKITQKNEKGEINTLESDRISAVMGQDAQGKRILKTLDATGNVVITTPSETLTGRTGLYNAVTNMATLSGGVTIRHGPNVLQGETAEINLTTNISRMLSGGGLTQGAPGRVRGVFYPGSEKKSLY